MFSNYRIYVIWVLRQYASPNMDGVKQTTVNCN